MSTIDLSLLPAPNVVEAIDYETILASMLADLQARDPTFDALVESDPAYKILEVCAYRETLLRQRVNDAARSVMLAYAGLADLENLAALYGVTRLIVDPGDPDAIPPVAPTYESDARLRERTQLALEGFSTAGPRGAYRFHALSASADVLDVGIRSDTPGDVTVTVLSTEGDGTSDQDLLDTVAAALSAEDVRPLSDTVIVESAEIVSYAVTASLEIASGPDAETVRLAAVAAVTAYVATVHRVGAVVARSGLYAALHQPGVTRVNLTSPNADVTCTSGQAPHCSGVAVTVA